MAQTCEKNGLLGLDFYLVKWYNTTMYNRLETFQHILAAIEQLPNNTLIAGDFYDNGQVSAIGALAPYNKLRSDHILFEREDFTQSFVNVLEKYDTFTCCQVQLFSDLHTQTMKLHERHTFMVRFLIETIENNGKWRLDNFAEICPTSGNVCDDCGLCESKAVCPCVEMEKDRQGIQRSKETNRRFTGLMSGLNLDIS